MTMLITTHEMNFAREFADQVCFLSSGSILEQGSPDQIFSDPKNDETKRFLRRIVQSR
jgi:polar amino acid transport system ATP-binding protein